MHININFTYLKIYFGLFYEVVLLLESNAIKLEQKHLATNTNVSNHISLHKVMKQSFLYDQNHQYSS